VSEIVESRQTSIKGDNYIQNPQILKADNQSIEDPLQDIYVLDGSIIHPIDWFISFDLITKIKATCFFLLKDMTGFQCNILIFFFF